MNKQCGGPGFDPWVGKIPREGKGYPLQYSGLENSMDCIDHGVTKSRTWLSLGGTSDDSYGCYFIEKLSIKLRQGRLWSSREDTKKESLHKKKFFLTIFWREGAKGKNKYIKPIVNQKFSFYPWHPLQTKMCHYFVYFCRKFQGKSTMILNDQKKSLSPPLFK